MLATSAFITSIVTSLIVFLIIYAIYSFLSLRPGNAVIYYPAQILSGNGVPSARRRGPIKWLLDLWRVDSDELTEIAGLDATVYVKFQSTCFMILLWAGVYCLPVIIAVSVTDNYYDTFNAETTDPKLQIEYSDIDKLAMGNVTPNTNRLWAGVIGAYWMTLGVILILFKTYRDIVKLRARHFGSTDSPFSPELYTALVRDIPKAGSAKANEEIVKEFFVRIHGSSYVGAVLCPSMRKVTSASSDLIKMRKKLTHSEGVFEKSKTTAEPEGVRPQNRTGFLGLLGPKVDSMEWYHEKVAEAEAKLREAQLVAAAKQGKAAVVFFNRRQQAAAAAQSMHAENADEWEVVPCPEPRDLEWANARIPSWERVIRESIVYALVFLIIGFYMIPIALISSLTTLPNLQKTVPFLKPIIEIAAVKTVLQAYLPQLALIIFLAVLPGLLHFLSKAEGIPAKSHITRAASGKYFYFIVFNVFLGVTFGSGLISSVQQVINSPTSIVNTLGSSLPQNASFFISFISLKFLVGKGLEISRLVPLIVYHLKKKYMCKTDQEVVEAWAPGPIQYFKAVPNDLLIITLGICYSVIAPLILPFAGAYFLFNWATMKNQVINVYVAEWESQGRMWPHIHNRIVAALLLAQLTFIGFFAIKQFVVTLLLIPLPIITLVYFFITHGRYYRSFQVSSLDVASRDAPEVPPTFDTLKLAYVAESMRPPEYVGTEPGVGTLPRKPADHDAKVHGLVAMREQREKAEVEAEAEDRV